MRVSFTYLVIVGIMISITSVSATQTDEEVIITVDSTNLRFSPSEVTIEEGQSIRFFWSGELLPHNAVAEDGTFDSGDPERNVDYTFFFNIGMNGTYDFVCEPHESVGMVGPITVLPTVSNNETDDDQIDPYNETESDIEHSESILELFSHGILLLSLIFSAYVIGKLSGKSEMNVIINEDE